MAEEERFIERRCRGASGVEGGITAAAPVDVVVEEPIEDRDVDKLSTTEKDREREPLPSDNCCCC